MEKIKQLFKSIPKAFVLFGRALKNAKKDFWISIQVLFWVSLALSILFYIVEHAAQPDEYPNWWQAFVWTITRYIGDPGHFSGKGPITLTGRHIDSIIGILKILIFAVPAGLVANGFRKAMDDDRKKKHLAECHDKIMKSFKRVRNPETTYRVVPRNVSIASLAVKRNMTENDIIETVGEYKEFKLRNIADTQKRSEHPQDRLVIELLPLQEKTVDEKNNVEKTSYGVKIDRGSNVTVVAPTADLHNSIGHFAYYLAQFGGFNLISRLFAEDVDDRVSYFTIEEIAKEKDFKEPLTDHERDIKNLNDFIDDIKAISNSKDKWNIIVLPTKKAPKAQVHFAHKNKEGESVTTLDGEKLSKFLAEFSEKLQTSHGIHTDVDNENFLPVGEQNISIKAGGGSTNNAFLMRLSYSLITWTDHLTPIIVDMAKIIRDNLEKPELRQQYEKDSKDFEGIKSSWQKKGKGYGIDEIQPKSDDEKTNANKLS